MAPFRTEPLGRVERQIPGRHPLLSERGRGLCPRAAVQRICGSPDLYPPGRRINASVNFITCHDGLPFTTSTPTTISTTRPTATGNTDGSNANYSWNCGAEGPTDDPQVLALRDRMRKNAFAVLLCSRGAACSWPGTNLQFQFGNNNPYCQEHGRSLLQRRTAKAFFRSRSRSARTAAQKAPRMIRRFWRSGTGCGKMPSPSFLQQRSGHVPGSTGCCSRTGNCKIRPRPGTWPLLCCKEGRRRQFFRIRSRSARTCGSSVGPSAPQFQL